MAFIIMVFNYGGFMAFNGGFLGFSGGLMGFCGTLWWSNGI
jgi:hypothetical protein